MTMKGRITIGQANDIAEGLVKKLKGKPGVFGIDDERVADVLIAGSCRRWDGSPSYTVGDIDIVILANAEQSCEALAGKAAALLDSVKLAGSTKVSGSRDGVQIDFRICDKKYRGSMLMHCTGSKWFNIRMRQKALQMGCTLSEYGLKKNGDILACESELEIFRALRMEHVMPQGRK